MASETAQDRELRFWSERKVAHLEDREADALLDALLRERGFVPKRASTESMVVDGTEASFCRVAYSTDWLDWASPLLVPSPTIYVPVQGEGE